MNAERILIIPLPWRERAGGGLPLKNLMDSLRRIRSQEETRPPLQNYEKQNINITSKRELIPLLHLHIHLFKEVLMKRILSTLITGALVFSMPISAVAQENSPYPNPGINVLFAFSMSAPADFDRTPIETVFSELEVKTEDRNTTRQCLHSVSLLMRRKEISLMMSCNVFPTGTKWRRTCLTDNPAKYLADWADDMLLVVDQGVRWSQTTMGGNRIKSINFNKEIWEKKKIRLPNLFTNYLKPLYHPVLQMEGICQATD